ncbi:MAG: transcriptional regulator [Clostridiales bacterium]|nr:transcriptional regulator [Clostridiales bacterium]
MSNKPKGKNDHAWEELFSKYDILNQIDMYQSFTITAEQIKEYREPRLMAKFDHVINLPHIFYKNCLTILPISRGGYIISNYEAYKKFENASTKITQAKLPEHIQSLDKDNIQSETVSINCALASGILNDFLGEEILVPTVSGRMGSDRFDFEIMNNKIGKLASLQVTNAQIEIDAAYEGLESLTLLEAKRDISEDFLIRQLYYPYRVWNERVTKKVRPVFLVYSNGIFSLYEYEFKVYKIYNSLELIQQKNYMLDVIEITISDLENLLINTQVIGEPEVAFPQADNFKRVINFCELLTNASMDRDEVTDEYAFDIRQTNYYTDACRYLGLVKKKRDGMRVVYQLTSKGKSIMSMPGRPRQLEFCKSILEHKAFYDTFLITLREGRIPNNQRVVDIMKQCQLYRIASDETYKRRASTISGWINWMLEVANG